MSVSDKAKVLLVHINARPDSGDIYQYYGWFMILLEKAVNNILTAEEKEKLLVTLPKFKNGSLKANDKIDELINVLSGQAGGRKRRNRSTKRKSRRTRRHIRNSRGK